MVSNIDSDDEILEIGKMSEEQETSKIETKPRKENAVEPSRRPSRRAAQLAVKKIHNIARNLAITSSDMPMPKGPSPEPVKKPVSLVKTQVKKIRESQSRPVCTTTNPIHVGLNMECYDEILSLVQAKVLMREQAEYNRVVKTLRTLKASNARIICLLNNEEAKLPPLPPPPPQTKVSAVVSSSNHSSNLVNLTPKTQSPNCTITVVPVRLVAVHASTVPSGTPSTVVRSPLSAMLTTTSGLKRNQ